jgi:hypothetical protein
MCLRGIERSVIHMRLDPLDQFSFLLYEDFPVPENSENVLAHKKAASFARLALLAPIWRPSPHMFGENFYNQFV